jgi:hypothetical protein
MEAMTRENENKKMMLFVDHLVDDLAKTSDEELLRETADLEDLVASIDAEIEAAINSAGKERLANARAEAAESRANRRNQVNSSEIPAQLADLIASTGKLSGLTLAARNGRQSSDDDAMSALLDLCELRQCQQAKRLPKFGTAPKAEQILRELGVTDPNEIDVEAIAWHLGAKVKYGLLTNCEARIVGIDDAAVITVDKRASLQRQRFSICHELGHWIYHRRQMLSCHADEIERPSANSSNQERVADRFASELLMPSYLFIAIAESLGPPSMRVVHRLSEIFNVSRTAAAIRLVELNQLPLLLVNHGRKGRRWFAKSKSVSSNWIPAIELRAENSAFNMIFGKGPASLPPKCVNASQWFGRRDASRFSVVEDSLRISGDEAITLLGFKEHKEFTALSE